MIESLMGTYAVLYREMLLFKYKLMRLGYVFYSISTPVLYLLAFGLGFGSRVQIPDYGAFLIQGIVCMSSMMNSFNMVSVSVGMGRLHSGAFQAVLTSPVSAAAVMRGLVISGIVRGLFACTMITVAGLAVFHVFPFSWLALFALILNTAFFSSAGVIVGTLIKDMEDHAVLTNFLMMPMAFFSGTFYPVDFLPSWLQKVIYLLPLSHANELIRAGRLTAETLPSFAILSLLTVTCFTAGVILLDRYSE
ncbi:ABC transporter permease [Seleniivibrio woodruffii]|uniref:Transport permease protein n=1 Tax=Seleniivibrio woodruffii TaxID=1078050 RepID=A0A4R1K355_9BACT|nr:ABC transporter permease [Seleniivibrio woodruffii]TCK58472.1 ABC-type polysaccharide/polyol phosphate export permease [Seleniivibrio woodruffii]TVZ36845.1 ABC-type polysaccharide/polyol phosphate export permease [Seleniivibrio woodruffii]